MPENDWLLSEVEKLRCTMHLSYRAQLDHRNGTLYNFRVQVCVLWLLERGYVDMSTAKGSRRIHAGQWIFQMPGLVLDQVFSKDAHIISFRFSMCWPTGRTLFSDNDYATVPVGRFESLHSAVLGYLELLPSGNKELLLSAKYDNEHEELYAQPDDVWKIVAARHIFLCHWYRAAVEMGFQPRGEYTGDHRVDRMIAILQEEMGNCTVPYQKIMDELDLSRAHIDRLCTDLLGHSPKNEHERFRFEYAQEVLGLSKHSIKQISFKLGFKSSSQFAKWYRRLSGQNPKEARLNYQGLV